MDMTKENFSDIVDALSDIMMAGMVINAALERALHCLLDAKQRMQDNGQFEHEYPTDVLTSVGYERA